MVNADARVAAPAESTRSSHRRVDENAEQPDGAFYRADRQLPDRASSYAEPPRRRLYEALGS